MHKHVQDSIVLLNVAHQHRCPKRLQGAAVRILGVFPNVESLRAHSSKHYTAELDLVAIPLRKWAAVLQHSQGDTNELQHLEKLNRAYKAREARHEEEFRSNVQMQRTGAVHTERQNEQLIENKDAGHAAVNESTMQEAPSVAREAELRLQTVAVISILPDVETSATSEQQPGLLVWGAYDTEESAREQIKVELATLARDVHLDTVTMYEWIPLTDIDMGQIREEFRDESLTEIMKSRKDETLQVDQYRALCTQRGQEPSVLDISPSDGTVRPDGELSLPPPLEKQSTIPNLVTEDANEEQTTAEGKLEERPVTAMFEEIRTAS